MSSDNKYDSIVVGAGIAGLTAATYLARDKQKILLIEKNSECGGLVSTFESDGFHFEAGVRALENAGVIFPMLKELGIELEFVKSPVSVGVGHDIINIEDIGNLDDYRDFLVRNYPENEQEINELIVVVRKIMKHMEVLYGIDNPVFMDPMNNKKYLFTKLIPWLPKFLMTIGKINRMNTPIEEYLESKISNQSLRDIIAQHFFKNTPTFFALSYFSLYLDYHYPVGGVGMLPNSLENKLVDSGGNIKVNTTISAINPVEKSITDEAGQKYYYDQMIWAADLKTLYRLVDDTLLEGTSQNRFLETRDELMSKRGSDSVFSMYLQLDEPVSTFKNIAHGHFFYTPSKTGLGETHTTELDDLLANWPSKSKQDIFEWMRKFVALNTFEISIPGTKDIGLVPENKTGMIVSFLAEYNLFIKLREDGLYEEFVEEMENQVLKVLSQSVYPGLDKKVLKRFSFTPLSYARRVGSSEGAIIGWSFRDPVPVPSKIQSTASTVNSVLPDIYQAGQWTFSPAGVPTAILTGKLAADKVIKRKRKFKK